MEITIPANKATLQIISSVYDQLVESGASIKIVLENVSPEALASMRPFVTVKGVKIEPVIPPPTTTTCPICRKRVVFFIDQDFVAPTSCPHCNAPVEPFAGDVEDLEDHLKVILGDQCTVKSSKKTVTGYNSDGILACAVRVSRDTWLVFTQTRAIALNEKDISKIVSGKVLAKRGITVRFVPTPGMPAPEVKPVSILSPRLPVGEMERVQRSSSTAPEGEGEKEGQGGGNGTGDSGGVPSARPQQDSRGRSEEGSKSRNNRDKGDASPARGYRGRTTCPDPAAPGKG